MCDVSPEQHNIYCLKMHKINDHFCDGPDFIIWSENWFWGLGQSPDCHHSPGRVTKTRTKKWIQHQQNGQTWDTDIKRSLSVVTSSIRNNRIILNWRDAVKTEKGWKETLHWNVRSDPALKCGGGRDVQMPPFYCRTLKLDCNIRSYFQFFCALCSVTYCTNFVGKLQSAPNTVNNLLLRICDTCIWVRLTCRRHLTRSPGAITMVVITPDSAPAMASWAGPSTSPSRCCKFFPIPKPMKLMEKEGMAITMGAPMPANSECLINCVRVNKKLTRLSSGNNWRFI